MNMIQSMTGFGRASGAFKDKTIEVELRAVNSKMADFKFKLPNNYRDRELDLRKMLTDYADRGKIDVSIELKSQVDIESYSLNKPLYRKYLSDLLALNQEQGYEDHQLTQAVIRIPNVLQVEEGYEDEEEWNTLVEVFRNASKALIKYRRKEGEVLRQDAEFRIAEILSLLNRVTPFEQERIQKTRERLAQLLSNIPDESVDKNRFEQELIYYLEKMDITEEKIRLQQHLNYYIEVLNDKSYEIKGRKLSFISQEIGREINTLGSKANHAEIQRLVIAMKDELEKIKEQLANIV
jgi:uncharacterized protein (TIGR00255 family)